LHTFCSNNNDIHYSYLQTVGALGVSFRREQKQLVILSNSKETISRARLLSDMHMRNIRTKMNMQQRSNNEGDTRAVNVGPGGMSGSSNMAGVKEAIVPIEPELLGLAIGRGGINV
ncbi:hypothetical protein, partial [Salmonella sp. s51228]|uniref:hypothetical protein n=1 Tax=Salmonella sp. s51228 TaxID=3159652 RepID=UPI0039808816